MAVLSIAPWSSYVDRLQPRFHMTEELALSLVLRDSRVGRTESVNAIGVTAERSRSQDGENAGLPGRSLEVATPGTPPWLDRFKERLPSSADPFLEYTAAAALYQEVQLLNRTLRDAAIPEGHLGYVVRMQITLLPRRRHAPYDAYTTIGFFVDQGSNEAEKATDLPLPATPMRGDEGLGLAGSDRDGVRVLPLLVTDSLEATLREQGIHDVFAMGLTLASFNPELAQVLGLDTIQQSSQDFLRGRDLNAMMTVGRLSENALQVRLGAMQEVTAEYAMVPRSYNVTALVTMPSDRAETLELVTRTRLVDAETGVTLPGSTQSELDEALARVLTEYGLDASLELAEQLLSAARDNDRAAYEALLDGIGAEDVEAHALWIDLVALGLGSQYASDRIDLPPSAQPGTASELFYEQTPLLVDDGVTSALRIIGLEVPDGTDVEGLLEVDLDVPVRIPMERVESGIGSKSVDLQGPSLRAAGLIDQSGPPMRLRFVWGTDEIEFDVVVGRMVAPEVPTPTQ